MAKTITTVGNAQVDTAQSKFGGASLLLDGAGDRLTLDLGSDVIGTGDFTLDYWIRHTSAFVNYITHIATLRGSTGFNVGTQALAQVVFYIDGIGEVLRGTGTNFTLNTWHHVAFVRNSGTLKAYVDGVEKASATNSTNLSNASFWIGDLNNVANEPVNGWMDEIRLSIGIARWTATFTPETSAYPCADTYTKLLVHCDGADASTTFTDDDAVCFVPQIIII